MGRPDASDPTNCAYCAFRPKPPTGSDEADPRHPMHYLYGTGNGAHSPNACMRYKTYLAFGGDYKTSPDLAPYHKRMLVEPRKRNGA